MTIESANATPETREVTDVDRDLVSQWAVISDGFLAMEKRLQKAFSDVFTLDPAESDIVLKLATADKQRLPMAALARAVNITTGGVTKIADRLERRNLVQRVPCVDDRRMTYLELTANGRELAEEAQCLKADIVRSIYTDVLGEKRAALVVDAMSTLRDANGVDE